MNELAAAASALAMDVESESDEDPMLETMWGTVGSADVQALAVESIPPEKENKAVPPVVPRVRAASCKVSLHPFALRESPYAEPEA